MPELPEVETIKRDLSKLIVGKKILDITTNSPKQVKPSLVLVKRVVVGKRILGIGRRGKLLIVDLGDRTNSKFATLRIPRKTVSQSRGKLKDTEDTEIFLLIHLKLTGRLLVRKKSDPVDDWQRITISLSEGKELRFCDLRKFGWVKIVNSYQLSVVSCQLGIEPFSKEFTVNYLKTIFAKTNRPTKIVLMDQSKIAGIGNIYANEALFLAGTDPRKPAKQLNNEVMQQLYKSIIKVLKAGIKHRGASDQYYLDALGHKGSYQDHFLVYQRDGKKCLKCEAKIKRIKLGGRGTFYCPKCQK